jgi:SSS family solute:Na+ symporter
VTGRAAFLTLAIGHAVGLGMFIATQVGIWPLHFTINVGIMTGLSAVLALALSRGRPDPDRVEGTVWRPGFAGGEGAFGTPVWADVRLWSALLVAGMVAILAGFW